MWCHLANAESSGPYGKVDCSLPVIVWLSSHGHYMTSTVLVSDSSGYCRQIMLHFCRYSSRTVVRFGWREWDCWNPFGDRLYPRSAAVTQVKIAIGSHFSHFPSAFHKHWVSVDLTDVRMSFLWVLSKWMLQLGNCRLTVMSCLCYGFKPLYYN